MIVYSVYDDSTDPWWARSAAVLRASLAEHAPTARVEIERAELASRGVRASFEANAKKSALWARRVEAAEDGEIVILLDSDVFVTGPLEGLVPPDRDLVVTPKYWDGDQPLIRRRLPINCGVIGVRVTSDTRWAMHVWDRVVQDMLADRALHAIWEASWGGIHQAALGFMLAQHPVVLEAARFGYAPAAMWNACHGPLWLGDPEQIRVVHVKSDLRRRVRRRATAGSLGRWVRVWWELLGHAVARGAIFSRDGGGENEE